MLKRTRPAVAKFALASSLLVIHMRKPVLVNRQACGTFHHQFAQTRGSLARNRFGNNSQIDWHFVLRKHVEQIEEPRIFPTHVVAAEKERYWCPVVIHALSQWIKPACKISVHN